MATANPAPVFPRGRVLDTVADMRLVNGRVGEAVIMFGQNAQNDGGGGVFAWQQGIVSGDDGVNYLVPSTSPTGRWARVRGANPLSLGAGAFGAVGDGTTDDTADLQTALDYGGVLDLGGHDYLISAALRVGNGVTLKNGRLVQKATATRFISLVNANLVAGNSGIRVDDVVFDGARPNAGIPSPWTAHRPYAEAEEIFNENEGNIYRCTVGGVSSTVMPTGTGTFVDGTVTWEYVCPQWEQGATPLDQSSLAYFSRCRDLRVRGCTFENARADGLIIEGSADAAFRFGPTLVPIGAFGTQVVTYWIVARGGSGEVISVSPGTRITNAPDVLSPSTLVRIEWRGILGAVSYDILKGDTRSRLDSTTALYNDDVGGTTTPYTPAGVSPTRSGMLEYDVNVEGCGFRYNNKAGLYLSSAEFVSGDGLDFDGNFEGLALGCAWHCSFTGVRARRNAQSSGLAIGRDSRYCYVEGNVDGVNTVVGEIASAPLDLHGRVYPALFSVTSVTPGTPGATAYTYWIVAKDVRGRVIGLSATATGHITNGGASPDNTIVWPAQAQAVSYDVLKLVAGYPELIVNQAGTTYHDTGAATSAYDYLAASYRHGFSDCILDVTVDHGSIVMRKSFRNLVEATLREPGSDQDVSSPHGVDLQGSSHNTVRAHVIDAGLDATTFGEHHAFGVEEYVDTDFGETLYSNDNDLSGRAIDTRTPQSMDAVFVKPNNLRNIVHDVTTNVVDGLPFTFQEPTTVAETLNVIEDDGTLSRGMRVTVGAQAGDSIDVAIDVFVGLRVVRVWLSDSVDSGPTSTPPDGGMSTLAGSELEEVTADIQKIVQTTAVGQYTCRITESTSKTFYVNVAIAGAPTQSKEVAFT